MRHCYCRSFNFCFLYIFYILLCFECFVLRAEVSFHYDEPKQKALSPVRNAIRKILPNPAIMYCYCSSIMGNNILVSDEEVPVMASNPAVAFLIITPIHPPNDTRFSLYRRQKGNSSGTNLLSMYSVALFCDALSENNMNEKCFIHSYNNGSGSLCSG